MEKIKNFINDETGMETVEWAVVAVIIVAAVIIAFRSIGNTVNSRISTLDSSIK